MWDALTLISVLYLTLLFKTIITVCTQLNKSNDDKLKQNNKTSFCTKLSFSYVRGHRGAHPSQGFFSIQWLNPKLSGLQCLAPDVTMKIHIHKNDTGELASHLKWMGCWFKLVLILNFKMCIGTSKNTILILIVLWHMETHGQLNVLPTSQLEVNQS